MAIIDWTEVPKQFHYWKEYLDKYGQQRPVNPNKRPSFLPEQIDELREIYGKLRARTDLKEFGAWISQKPSKTLKIAGSVAALLGSFEKLSQLEIKPFTGGPIIIESPPVVLDWSKLPRKLSYAVGPAEKYGVYQFDDQVKEFFNKATDLDLSELREFSAMVHRYNHGPAFQDWVRKYKIVDHPEAARVYFLFGLCEELERI